MENKNLLDYSNTHSGLIDKTEILDKVKPLNLIPEIDGLTVKQVADYYEIDVDTIRMCYRRNKERIGIGEVAILSISDFEYIFNCNLELIKYIKHKQGFLVVEFKNGLTLKIPNRGVRVYSKKAILNIGILLSNCEIANKVQRQLMIDLGLYKGSYDFTNYHIFSERKETKFVSDIIEFFEAFGIKGVRQYNVDNKYRIDFYIPKLKIAIEYDENNHSHYDKHKEHEREKYIKNKLHCKFIRVSDKNSNIKNIGIVAKEMYKIYLESS